jgi:hypothetical protein
MNTWSEKEKTIIELLKQKKRYREIEQELHVSSRDISHTKKKDEAQQNKIQSGSEVVPEQHKDQKCEPNTGTISQVNQDIQQDDIYEAPIKFNKEIIREKEELNNIIFSQREEIQVLKDELNRACTKRRSGIIIMKTDSLHDEVRFLLNRDAEYCYLIYEDKKTQTIS